MKRHFLYIAALSMVVLYGCSNDNSSVSKNDQKQVEINLSSELDESGLTRSFEATNIPVNSTVWVWADQINASNNERMDYFYAWRRTADGTGKLNGSSVRLFPATNVLNFYAMKGNFTTTITEASTLLPEYDVDKGLDGIVHTVNADQTTAAAFHQSDLLYGQLKDQAATNSSVAIPFYHMLSRVQVVLIPGHGLITNNQLNAEDLHDAVVTILNVKNKVKFTADKTKNIALVDPSTNDPEPGRALRQAMLSLPAIDNDAATITVKTEVSTEGDLKDNSFGDAIVVPQTIPAGNFIKVEYLGRETYFRLTEPLELLSGKRYRFKLYLDRIGGTFEFNPVTVETWGANSTTQVSLDNLSSTSNL